MNIQRSISDLHDQKLMPSNFMKTSRFIARAFGTAILPLTLVACNNSTHVSTHAAGHSISAQIEGNHSVDSQPARAVLSSQYGRITIERARVRLEGLQWTAIPEEVPVMVGISAHKRWVTAGAVTVKETSR